MLVKANRFFFLNITGTNVIFVNRGKMRSFLIFCVVSLYFCLFFFNNNGIKFFKYCIHS